jgi:hypothetical protein
VSCLALFVAGRRSSDGHQAQVSVSRGFMWNVDQAFNNHLKHCPFLSLFASLIHLRPRQLANASTVLLPPSLRNTAPYSDKGSNEEIRLSSIRFLRFGWAPVRSCAVGPKKWASHLRFHVVGLRTRQRRRSWAQGFA